MTMLNTREVWNSHDDDACDRTSRSEFTTGGGLANSKQQGMKRSMQEREVHVVEEDDFT